MANGNVLTPTPLRSNSTGNSKCHPNSNNNNGSNIRLANNETDTPSGVNGLSDKGENKTF
jgi:hypothetical protein